MTRAKTMDAELKRYPSTILRRAMTHLRKDWMSSKSATGRQTLLTIKQAIVHVEQAQLEIALEALRREQ